MVDLWLDKDLDCSPTFLIFDKLIKRTKQMKNLMRRF